MGIFTERDVQRGEELVFNYNVDRYGADPQRCYCGEPDCVGFIGGRTQTERATKLSNLTIQALGLDEAEAWDVTVAKKIRKKKPMSDDEEYCEANQARQLNREGAQKLVAAMLLERERWVVVQMLDRLQSCQEEAVLSRVAVVHGYNAMNAHLLEWQGDAAILLQILDILFHLPRLSKNKIEDAHIEPTVQALASHADDSVRDRASSLLSEWAALQRAYRIPRKRKEDVHLAISTPSTPSATDGTGQDENGQADISTLQHRTRFPSNSAGAPPPPTSQPNRVPVAPRNWTQAPKPPAWNVPRRFDIRIKGSLPSGWTSALHDGQQYYFSVSGKTTWQRPTAPDDVPPPPPAPIKSTEQRLQDIVDGITKAGLAATVQPVQQGPSNGELEAPKEVKREEKWRKLPLEKQQKLYESSVS